MLPLLDCAMNASRCRQNLNGLGLIGCDQGGEEENDGVNAHTQGPVKMFKGTKYNKDVLPSGEVNPETLRRLERSLTDDGPEQYTRVLIDDGDGSVLQESSDAAPPLRGSTKATIVSGVKLPPAISKGIAQRWLDEVGEPSSTGTPSPSPCRPDAHATPRKPQL